jgi:SAM-dependent methyltransferase
VVVAELRVEKGGQPRSQPLPPQPTLDPALLERVALFSARKLVMVRGCLCLPCEAALLDEAVNLIRSMLESFWQQPPPEALLEWRRLLAEQIAQAQAKQPEQPAQLRIAYRTLDDAQGLTGGLQLKISTEALEVAHPLVPTEASAAEQLACLSTVRGEIRLPALPSLLDHHVEQIRRALEGLEQTVTDEEMEGWRDAIAPLLPTLFQASPNAYLRVHYETLDLALGLPGGIRLHISGEVASIAEEYYTWTQTRQGPLFGSHADAKVLDVAALLGNPAESPILDIGAGTGRNSLALARLGFPVDAVELAPALAEQLIQAKTDAGLDLSVVQGDILDPHLPLPKNHYRLIFLSEVIASHFRSVEEVRGVCDRICTLLQPGGYLLFNAFLAADGYQPSPIQRELSQAFWCCIFTHAELDAALADLPLILLTDEPETAYERANLPTAAWPPTEWFEGWATGRNLFPILEQPQVELRWILLKNTLI